MLRTKTALALIVITAPIIAAGNANGQQVSTQRSDPMYSGALASSNNWIRSGQSSRFNLRVSNDVKRAWVNAGGIRIRDVANVNCYHTVRRTSWQTTCSLGIRKYAVASFVKRDRGYGRITF